MVYLIGTLILGARGCEFGPHLVAQIKGLNGAVPQIFQDVSTGKTAAGFGVFQIELGREGSRCRLVL